MKHIPDNPFFRPGGIAPQADAAPANGEKALRFREVTTSPAEEYSLRDGKTQAFPEFIEAYLCQENNIGHATVTEKGITIRNKVLVGRGNSGETRTYWSENSILINEAPAHGEARKIVYVFNALCTDYIHVLDPKTRRYIETIAAKDRPAFFDQQAVAEEHAKHQRQLNRHLDRFRDLHQKSSLEELDRSRENAAETQRIVNLLDLPEEDQPTPPHHRNQTEAKVTANTRNITASQRVTSDLIDEAEDEMEQLRNNRPVEAHAYDPMDDL